MTQYSHSRVECFNSCPYKFKLRYLDKLKVIEDYEPNNALICGNTIHTGAEKGLDEALQFYKNNFNVFSDKNIDEVIKFEYLIPNLIDEINQLEVLEHEHKIDNENFIGYVDLITKNDDGTVNVYDFKYSNNIEKYKTSPQLHLYKYYLEQEGFKVDRMFFIFVPKVQIRQKKTETLFEYRERIKSELENKEIQTLEIKYDSKYIDEYLFNIKLIENLGNFFKNESKLCHWCDYEKYCKEGIDYMTLPSTERRTVDKPQRRKIWLYGPPFSGKTSMLDEAPNPLNLNTDGNVEFVTMPYVGIKDVVTMDGRIKNTKKAWEVFKESIEELEKNDNGFETLIVDLLEDCYEHCRLYMYDKLGITHESDDSFKAWDKVRIEFLSTIKRLMNLDYKNIVLISHEDTSKDITKKTGDKITAIKPNLNDKMANKIAGMVDIVARVVVDGDSRTLNFKSDEVVFGGGRLKNVKENSIPLSWDELVKVYDTATIKKESASKKKTDSPVEQPQTEPTTDEQPQEEKPKRTRKPRKTKEEK